nr:MAG TPA: hypothetical protein [Caudoviricetes sp.]
MFKVVYTYYPSGSTFSPLGYFCTLFWGFTPKFAF